jgi:hypothetical protein
MDFITLGRGHFFNYVCKNQIIFATTNTKGDTLTQKDEVINERNKRFNEAKALVDGGGMTVKEACKKAQIHISTYYGRLRGDAPKALLKPKAFLEIPLKTETKKVAIVVCDADQVARMIESLT